jgi:hypothetical protein
MRTRTLHGPKDYFGIDPEYRLWIWPQDLNEAVGRLNLIPTPQLVGARNTMISGQTDRGGAAEAPTAASGRSSTTTATSHLSMRAGPSRHRRRRCHTR